MNVDPSPLFTADAIGYYSSDHHRLATYRKTLDILNLPYPSWAKRKRSGPPLGSKNRTN